MNGAGQTFSGRSYDKCSINILRNKIIFHNLNGNMYVYMYRNADKRFDFTLKIKFLYLFKI